MLTRQLEISERRKTSDVGSVPPYLCGGTEHNLQLFDIGCKLYIYPVILRADAVIIPESCVSIVPSWRIC